MKKIEMSYYDGLDLIRILQYAKSKRKEDYKQGKSKKNEMEMYVETIDGLLDIIQGNKTNKYKDTTIFNKNEEIV